MTFKELQNKAITEYYPALFLERVIPHHSQHRMRKSAWMITACSFFLLIVIFVLSTVSASPLFHTLLPKIYGLFFISIPFLVITFSLQAFYNSFYFKDIPDVYVEKDLPIVSFELAHILYLTSGNDVLVKFLKSHQGREIVARSGISQDEITEFLAGRKQPLLAEKISFKEDHHLTYIDYAGMLFDTDEEFSRFLFAHSIQRKDFIGIVEWVLERERAAKEKKRWWSRDRLGRIPGIGKGWSYGRTFYLDAFTRELPAITAGGMDVHDSYGSKELEELEAVLIKNKGANAFLIGNDREGQLDIVARLDHMIAEGTAYPEIEHKRVVVFDANLMVASIHNKTEFETRLLEILNEAEYAGNIILVIPDFPSFVGSAESYGTDLASILDRYFTSPQIHMVGLCDIERYHNSIERNGVYAQRFEKILIQEIDTSNTIRVLENEIIQLERQHGIYFTYPSLLAIADSAERYFPDAIMPDRAVELLFELAPAVAAQGRGLVTKDEVYSLIKTKTGIPVGQVSGEEREKLINLESILHQRIIGQDVAVVAIANAVRRARSGINNPNRPLASFMFLGPTGVGKTETTKALADVFFGAEAKIERLDMSEYTGGDSVAKLIGSFEMGKSGVLSTMLREHPYGVLLLDEFEKTIPEVMNLFLQILDEGFFSDMSGKKINARNLLIIATSNAGSDLIWEAVKKGDDLAHAKDLIMDAVIHAGIFKPELLNRFDGVIVFHPLAAEHLYKIAELQLIKLKKRLATRGINLKVNEDLIKYVTSYGTDPKFGARPMNRAIQDKVEQVIADKMIRGTYKQGSEIELSTIELTK